jgi:hypothetical protein
VAGIGPCSTPRKGERKTGPTLSNTLCPPASEFTYPQCFPQVVLQARWPHFVFIAIIILEARRLPMLAANEVAGRHKNGTSGANRFAA